jgi:hypothetical protein
VRPAAGEATLRRLKKGASFVASYFSPVVGIYNLEGSVHPGFLSRLKARKNPGFFLSLPQTTWR